MAAAVYESPRHHNREVEPSASNMCNIQVCNSPKHIGSDNVSHINSSHQLKPFGAHSLNIPNQTSITPTFGTIPKVSSGYHHHSLPATLLQIHAKTNYHHHYHSNNRQFPIKPIKRKSAVELLAESKPFYVKSEAVLDRKQRLAYKTPISSNQKSSSCLVSPTRFLHQPKRADYGYRRSVSSTSDLLQNKLRKLLNDQVSNRPAPLSIFQPADVVDLPSQYLRYDNSGVKYRPSSQYISPKSKNPEVLMISPPDRDADVSVFFPSAFLSPQSLPPHNLLSDASCCAEFEDDALFLTDYQTISPPAEYAEEANISNTVRYDSSNGINDGYKKCSTKQPVDFEENDYLPLSYQINSHKSLPDLHSQLNRYSPHSERSRGNLSIPGSFNQGSVGSSGHYTRKSEPCCKQPLPEPVKLEYFRDSGFSTQHSEDYNVFSYDFLDHQLATDPNDVFCPLPEAPIAFQDDYVDDGNKTPILFSGNEMQPPIGGISGMDPELSPPLGTFKRQKCLRYKNRRSRCSSPSGRNCSYSARSDERKPILRSKSDISDTTHWNRKPWDRDDDNMITTNKNFSGNKEKQNNSKTESFSELIYFFDQLGLDDKQYQELGAREDHYDSNESSPVFFSDTSTVDSNHLPDSTETQPAIQPYRPPETTSIVERNARIIKWLCNCKKLQILMNK